MTVLALKVNPEKGFKASEEVLSFEPSKARNLSLKMWNEVNHGQKLEKKRRISVWIIRLQSYHLIPYDDSITFTCSLAAHLAKFRVHFIS